MAENQFTSTIETLFKGMDQFVTTKTVVGEPAEWRPGLLQRARNRNRKAAGA